MYALRRVRTVPILTCLGSALDGHTPLFRVAFVLDIDLLQRIVAMLRSNYNNEPKNN
ncbi:hypothetical protein RO3G_08673 [Rhizopus delemar RA 99-880]|uniref:Uncharacterized protein n=1 Tax=Rhizopus delemar (strain RA 99-880 / ATCC MYA-4621 / FGSC 9543 / NRRL 43880) TaxID=246409 RepID=I1C688_RHIO9|nr:hypothetical protein RO3G_08673 [Rhizopus delemar RA 99-880]|eukprot:EIE83968.1 hypothetical protein RO3G_08673 [Rhizopus delemar RA 99-880]